jgi:hypothetical protein
MISHCVPEGDSIPNQDDMACPAKSGDPRRSNGVNTRENNSREGTKRRSLLETVEARCDERPVMRSGSGIGESLEHRVREATSAKHRKASGGKQRVRGGGAGIWCRSRTQLVIASLQLFDFISISPVY